MRLISEQASGGLQPSAPEKARLRQRHFRSNDRPSRPVEATQGHGRSIRELLDCFVASLLKATQQEATLVPVRPKPARRAGQGADKSRRTASIPACSRRQSQVAVRVVAAPGSHPAEAIGDRVAGGAKRHLPV
jgi:hypothetical protein